jgi:Fic family protein
MFHPLKPFNGLPKLPPATDIETKPILKACVTARAALAELKIAGQLIPDQTVLINTIPVLETRDSSEIENIVTTNDALFRQASMPDDEADPAAKEALRYRTALYQGFNTLSSRPLSSRTAVELCRTITGIDLDIRALPGTAVKNAHTGEITYTPPEGPARLRDLLADWETYLNADTDIDPLVRMAVLHYQFEAIHPFPDGNGRAGRVLNILMLVQAGLIDLPTLYLSRAILRTRADYYRLLLNVSAKGEWEPWIVYMLRAVAETSAWTNAKVCAIRALMDATADHVRVTQPKIYSRELIDVMFAQPYVRIGNLVERGIAKRETASVYLKAMVQAGVLLEEKAGRDKVFIHRKYLDLLSAEGHGFQPYKTVALAKPKPRKRTETT